ncbi:MAG TPA: phospholipase D-like domain-containing protein [Chthoniobacterales bacterium]
MKSTPEAARGEITCALFDHLVAYFNDARTADPQSVDLRFLPHGITGSTLFLSLAGTQRPIACCNAILVRKVKRKPSSSLTWPRLLGVAVGSGAATLFIARNFFETERKIRHRIHADYGVNDEVFERVMGQLMGPPLVPGNEVTILQNGDEIFPAMLEAIRAAKRTITFENFLWHEGRVANAFAEALAERARAGVNVHMLQDAFGCSGLHARAMNTLRNSPVELELFRWSWLGRVNFRTHRKLLVVDGRVGFLGGTCISDAWEGDGVTSGRWRDTHYRVEGPAVAQLQQAFLDNWMQTRAQVLHGEKFFPKPEPKGTLRAQAFKSSASEGADGARLMFLLSIAAARKSVRIANAFFIPDDLCRRTLIEARDRGVEVDVIAPGEENDAPLSRLAGRSRWRPLLESGVRLWEYQPARFHCKYMIVDDSWCSVGSTNLDHRSLRLNEEANLNVLDRDFAARHTRIFEEDLGRSRPITLEDWRQRPWTERAAGNLAALARTQM